PKVLGGYIREHLGDALCGPFGCITFRHVMGGTVHDNAPDMTALVDRRVRVDQHITTFYALDVQLTRKFSLTLARLELPRRSIAHDNSSDARVHEAVRVMAIDYIVMEAIHQIGWLSVVARLAYGHDVLVHVDLAILHFAGDSAVGDIADITVMQRVEVG